MTEEIAANEPLDVDTDTPPRHDWRTLLTIGVGGAVGTTARYLLAGLFPHLDGVPVGILVINVTGAFLIGVLVESLALRGDDTGRRRRLRLLLGTGVLGGYTTYSALAVDSASMLETGRVALSLGYGLVTVIIGGIATWLGIALARKAERRTTPAAVSMHSNPERDPGTPTTDRDPRMHANPTLDPQGGEPR